MIFEQLIFQAKEGDLESITDILNMYRPLLLKYSVIDGRLDEDLYQEQCITLMRDLLISGPFPWIQTGCTKRKKTSAQ